MVALISNMELFQVHYCSQRVGYDWATELNWYHTWERERERGVWVYNSLLFKKSNSKYPSLLEVIQYLSDSVL